MELNGLWKVQELLQQYKILYRVTYGGENKEVINLEIIEKDAPPRYAIIEDEKSFSICDAETLNIIDELSFNDIKNFILYIKDTEKRWGDNYKI